MPPEGVCAVEIICDNRAVINLLNVQRAPKREQISNVFDIVDRLHEFLFKLWSFGVIVPRDLCLNFSRHVRREFNEDADSLATRALLNG